VRVSGSNEDHTCIDHLRGNHFLFCQYYTFVCVYLCKDGWTPLHLASYGGHIEAVRLLLGKGADIEAQDKVRTRVSEQ
jgi:hypothetical protein